MAAVTKPVQQKKPNPYEQDQIDKANRYLQRYATMTNPTDAQKKTYQQILSTYSKQALNNGRIDPTKATPEVQRYYRQANPYSDFTKQVEMRYLNRITDALKNNTGVSDAQMKQYQDLAKKWNYQKPEDKFEFDYTPISYEEAANRAKQQLDPLYQRALENIKAQKYQNELNAGEIAAKRGLSHSGLAADQLTKIAIASQGQMSDVEAERAAKIAEMAQRLVEQDQARADALRQQMYREFADQRNFGYQQQRDQRRDAEWESVQKYERAQREKEFNRRVAEWESAQKWDRAWKQYVYNNMSAAEKAQLEWAKQQFGEEMAWRMFETKYNGELEKSIAQAELDYYKNFTGDEKGGGSNTKGPVPSPQSFQTHMSQAVKMGVPASWVPALTELIRRESSFNPRAKNPKSTAYGYGQFLKSTRSAYEKKTGLDYDNPVHQIVMMAQYVKDRYGTPEKALAFWDRNKWY
jgi:Transglycosylase SLT domain